MKLSRKESLRRKRISEGLKRHYKNLRRYEAIKKKRRAAVKGKETKFKKRMLGCVVVFDGAEYAFMDREHVSAQAIQVKLNLFPDRKYIIKCQVWLGVRTLHSTGVDIISGSGTTDLTELIFDSHVTYDPFWTNYYAAMRTYLEEHVSSGTKYDSADFQLREMQVC